MSIVRFRLENGDKVVKQLARLKHDGSQMAAAGAEAGAEQMKAAVQANIVATFRQHSGRLHDDWTISTQGKETTLSTDTVYARIHEVGGVITPVRARFLSWEDEESGERIFAKRVTIPARPYFRPAWDSSANLSSAERAMTAAINAAVSASLSGQSFVQHTGRLVREFSVKELGW